MDFKRRFSTASVILFVLLILSAGSRASAKVLYNTKRWIPKDIQGVNVMVWPANITVHPDQTFTVSVRVTGNGAVVGADMWLHFDPVYFQALAISDGGALPVRLAGSIDNKSGIVKYGAGTFGAPVSAPFTLCYIRFHARSMLGTSNLVLDSGHTDVQGESGSLLSGLGNGTVHVVPLPPPTPTPTPTPPRLPTMTPTPTPTTTPTPTPPSVHICVQVFSDLDRDGQKEEGEPLLEGVRVFLKQGKYPWTPVEERRTQAERATCFSEQLAGTYIVEEQNPPGYVSTSPDIWGLVLKPGAEILLAFADAPTKGHIYGVLFEDVDGDGVQGGDERPIPHALLRLREAKAHLRLVQEGNIWETITDEEGKFEFDGLPFGAYLLEIVSVPPGFLRPGAPVALEVGPTTPEVNMPLGLAPAKACIYIAHVVYGQTK